MYLNTFIVHPHSFRNAERDIVITILSVCFVCHTFVIYFCSFSAEHAHKTCYLPMKFATFIKNILSANYVRLLYF